MTSARSSDASQIKHADWKRKGTLNSYLELLKPRVMILVIFTAVAGLVLAPGSKDIISTIVTIVCISVGAGASASLNMWYDADIDAIMARTARRPIPTGRISPMQALVFGLILSVLSVSTLGIAIDWFAACLLALTIGFYAVVYTVWLKRSTPQNIVIGGAAGALPPVIGWSAVTGNVSFDSFILFLIIFFWTPPHFWALALFSVGDYEAARVPMMPNVAGPVSTKRQMLIYAGLTALSGVMPSFTGLSSPVYGLFAAVLGAIFIALSIDVLRMPDSTMEMAASKRMFFFSLLYLFAIFAALMIDAVFPTK